MKLLLFWGNSLKNKDELLELASSLQNSGNRLILHFYRHWENPSLATDVEHEAFELFKKLENETEVILVCKSIGTLIAMRLLKKLIKKNRVNIIKKIILAGIPAKDFSEEENREFYEILSQVAMPVFVIQNNADPHGNIQDAKRVLGGLKYELIEEERADHFYGYPEEIDRISKQ